MDSSSLEGQDSLVKETTDGFCRAFAEERDFHGSFAESVARGPLPPGVDARDPRVVDIVRRCRERAAEEEPESAFTD